MGIFSPNHRQVPREDDVDTVFTGGKTARSDKAHRQIDK